MAESYQPPTALNTLSSADWVLFNNLKRLSDNTAQNTARLRVLEECVTRLIAKVDALQQQQQQANQNQTPACTTSVSLFGTNSYRAPTQPLGYGGYQGGPQKIFSPGPMPEAKMSNWGVSGNGGSELPPIDQQTWWPSTTSTEHRPRWAVAKSPNIQKAEVDEGKKSVVAPDEKRGSGGFPLSHFVVEKKGGKRGDGEEVGSLFKTTPKTSRANTDKLTGNEKFFHPPHVACTPSARYSTAPAAVPQAAWTAWSEDESAIDEMVVLDSGPCRDGIW